MQCANCPCPKTNHSEEDRRECLACSCPMYIKRVPSWDDYFFGICDAVSLRSKDESTELGAIIIDERKRIVATGYNSFPSGIRDVIAERQVRPLKYLYMEHAERNAIYNAVARGCTIYCAWLPCPDCARAIISVGLSQIVVKTTLVPERWKENMAVAVQMLLEAQINIRLPNQVQSVSHDTILKGLEI